MRMFFGVISNPEFWIAIGCGFIISVVLAYIVQELYLMWIDDDTTEYRITGEKLSIGCLVYDVMSETVGIYCGTYRKNNILCGVVVNLDDDTVYCYYPELVNLITVEQE